MDDPANSFLLMLVERHPRLSALLTEHREYYDELVPYNFVADLTRWLVSAWISDRSDATVGAVLSDLEREFAASSPRTEELIAVGFVENLPYDDEPGGGLAQALGPELRRELERQRGHP